MAWGSAIPSVFCELILWPAYISRLVFIPVRIYLWQTWIRTGMAAIPFALACAAAEHFWHPRNLLVFFLQIGILLPLGPLSLYLVFRKEVETQVRGWRERRLSPSGLDEEHAPTTTTVE